MSVAGILGSSLFSSAIQNLFHSKKQQVQQEFQQLGQDLQSGNLSAAQSDFATLQQMKPQPNSTSSSQDSNPLSQDFTQLSQDLQSGKLSAAQQDYTKIQQDFQSQSGQMHHHHHHGGGGGSEISQVMAQLGQSLQSGNLSAAQQAYSSLQQDFQLFGQTLSTQASSSSNSVSFNA